LFSFRAAEAMEWTPDRPGHLSWCIRFRLEEYTGFVPQMFALRLSTALNPADNNLGICILCA